MKKDVSICDAVRGEHVIRSLFLTKINNCFLVYQIGKFLRSFYCNMDYFQTKNTFVSFVEMRENGIL